MKSSSIIRGGRRLGKTMGKKPIKKDLDFNGLALDMVDNTLWHYLINVADST